MCAKFHNGITQWYLEVVKVLNFSDKKPGFLEMKNICLNLGIGFCINWLVVPNYKEIIP